MQSLDPAYRRILQIGIIAVRDAAANGDIERCRVEAEHIHNIPSLIGEENVQRHLYYVSYERKAYIDWIAASGRADLQKFMSQAYSSAWKEMDEVLMVGAAADTQRSTTGNGDTSNIQ
jgi:hypothetical protein